MTIHKCQGVLSCEGGAAGIHESTMRFLQIGLKRGGWFLDKSPEQSPSASLKQYVNMLQLASRR